MTPAKEPVAYGALVAIVVSWVAVRFHLSDADTATLTSVLTLVVALVVRQFTSAFPPKG